MKKLLITGGARLSGTVPDTRRKKQRAAGSGGMLSVHFAVCVT